MNQFVQAAITAAQQGNKFKAFELLKGVLSTNPNDVEAWLVLSRLIDHPDRKRQCLNRVLTLDASNKIAREELLKLDRAAMGAPPAQPVSSDQRLDTVLPLSAATQDTSAPMFVEPAQPFASPSASPISAPGQVFTAAAPVPAPLGPSANPPSQKSSNARKEKPFVFKYPIFWRILVYLFMAIFGCMGLFALQDISVAILPCGLALLLIPVVWIVSPVVEVSDSGLKVSRMFGTAQGEVAWDHIARIKANSMGQGMELITEKGVAVKVSSQVSGYPAIVEILRRKRPDLFSVAAIAGTSGSTSTDHSTSAFTGTKTFQKNFFSQYSAFLLMVPLCLVAVWAIASEKQYVIGVAIALIALVFMTISLFAVSVVKVESNKLSTESFFGEKEFTAQQIRNISMKTVRSRHGHATNYIRIEPLEGSAFNLAGFSEGVEVIYGFLMNWWNTYRNS